MTSNCKVLSVGFISLGCAKNMVDSQTMAGFLIADNLILAAAPEEADVVIVNTCAFINDAREESLDAILSACELKRDGFCSYVIVAGCMPQRYRNRISKEMPEVDAFIGLDQLDQVGTIVKSLSATKEPIVKISSQATKIFEPKIPVVFSGGSYAYLKIAEGCNHKCSFCAIPGIRGRHRSRSVRQIVAEAESLLNTGFRELDVISQDTTFYGRDLKQNANLSLLLKELAAIDGDFWIRILYGYPSQITDELLETIASTPRACNYLDVPIQHSDSTILKKMARGETVDFVHNMAERIRSFLPDAALRTTCLVGFPGETKNKFSRLLDFIKETRFDNLGVFVYSPEEDTKAYDMSNVPPFEVAEERRKILMETQREIVNEKARGLIGKEDIFLLDCPDANPKTWIARSFRNAPEIDGIVRINKVPGNKNAGDFIRATYTAQDEYDMRATFFDTL